MNSIMAAYFGGLLASLSPCCLPMLPITIGFLGSQGAAGKKSRVLMYVFGQMVGFCLTGALAVFLGEALGFTSESWVVNLLMSALMFVFGFVFVTGKMPGVMNKWNTVASGLFSDMSGDGAAALIGLGSVFVASPCTTPILSSILAYMAVAGSEAKGVAMMVGYSLGFSSLFLIFGLGLVKANKMPRAGKWMKVITVTSGALMLIAGCYYAYKGETTALQDVNFLVR